MGTNFSKKILAVMLAATTFGTVMTGCTSKKQGSTSAVTENAKTNATDKKSPEIKFVAETVTVETGAKYTPASNIESVTDDVDGKLTQVKQKSAGAAYYLVDDSKLDTTKAGEYSVTVTASDKAGNVATKSFKVTVKDPAKKETSSETKKDSSKKTETKNGSSEVETKKSNKSSSSSNSSTSKPAQNNSNSGNSSSNSSQSKPAQTQQHVHNWVHHEATGHYDTKVVTDKAAWDEVVTDQAAWDEKVSDGGYRCNGCGQIFATGDQLDDHFDSHDGLGDACDGATSSTVESKYVHHDAVTHTVHHDAVTHTEQVWVQDAGAYDECSGCGKRK